MTEFKAGHNALKMALVISATFMFGFMVFFNFINSSIGNEWGVFQSSVGKVSNKYSLEILPTGSATKTVWFIIYFWQAAWLIYSLTLICRQYSSGYLHVETPVIPLSVYGIYVFTSCSNISWLLVWDREQLVAACIFLYLLPGSLWVILFITFREFPKTANALVAGGNTLDIWLVRLFFHNGIAVYAGWTTVASNFSLGSCLVYISNLTNSTGCSICLGILTVEILVIFTCEIIIFEKQFRYVFAHYIPLLAGTTGSYLRNSHTASQTNSIWITILMCLVLVCIVIKIIRSIYMHVKHPLYKGSVNISAAALPTKDELA